MLPPLGSGRDGRLRACASGVLLAAVLGAGMALVGTAAGAEQDEPAPPPVQIGPPPVTAPPSAPTNPPPTAIVILVPPQSPTITLTVPAVPAAKQAVAKQASASAAAPAAKEETAAPRSAARTRERDPLRQTRSYVEPTAPKATAKPKPKRKPKPVSRPKQLPAAVSAPVVPRYAVVVRDSSRASATLGVQLPPQAVAASPPDNGLYLLIALAVAGSLLLGVAGAASRLAGYWPKLFIPVIRERDGLSFFGACLIVCGIVAWAIVAPVA